MERLSVVEATALIALMEKATGVRCTFLEGGPSMLDPLGQIRVLVGFRGKNCKGIVVRFLEDGCVELGS